MNIKRLFKEKEKNKYYLEKMIKIRREIHSNPEPGFQEKDTANLIYRTLQKAGIKKIKRNIGKTGVVALVEGKKSGPTIALRADMDALPIQEENDFSFSSKKNGLMHACGHDGHTAMLITAAEFLQENINDLKGNVKLIFQPAEEMLGGAEKMIEDGVMEDPVVDAIIGLHLTPELSTGEVGVKIGAVMSAMDKFEIIVQGKEAHGAMPHQGVDAIHVANRIALALQDIVSRELDPFEPAVITIGEIKGGTAYNILASNVEMKGTIRTFSKSVHSDINIKMKKTAENIAKASGAGVDVNITELYPLTINNRGLINLIEDTNNLYSTKQLKNPYMSSEDISYYFKKSPGALILIGAGDNNRYSYPLHHSRFDFDENALMVGLKVLINSVYNFFKNNKESIGGF